VRPDGIPRAIAGCAFATVCLAPFLFGAVERSVWIPLCQLWLGAGLVSALCQQRRMPGDATSVGTVVSRALLPVHALFLVQLIPLPAAVLHAISPGSFAAHFLPDPGDGRFRPLSVSPSATIEAWLYVAGLQGLFLALQGLPINRRRRLGHVLLGAIVCLAGEGLWQSRTAHPAWLYGWMPIEAPSGLDTATFGPYYNRNHFATVMALGAAWACGLALALIRERGGLARLLASAAVMTEFVVLAGASLLLVLSAAASGSRSGAGAAIAAIAFVLARVFGARRLVLPMGVGLAVLTLSGAAAIDRLMRLDIVMSRWAPWADMTRLWRFFPIFGSGIGTFGETYWPYQLNAAYEFWQHAHNEYLEWTIEAGLAGLLVAWLTGRSISRSVAFADWAREASVAALVAVALQALLDFPFRIPANAALLVCAIALGGSARTGRSPAP
jgi:hypothetical protein